MEDDKERQKLNEEMLIICSLIHENPCGMSAKTMRGLIAGIKSLFGTIDTGMNLEQVSRYFGVDARTIRRWRKEYPDFPEGKKIGENSLSFPADKIVEWKIRHNK